MYTRKSKKSARLSDWIVIPAATAITTAVSLGIYAISAALEVGLGWLISVLIIMLISHREAKAKPYGKSIQIGMDLGLVIGCAVVALIRM